MSADNQIIILELDGKFYVDHIIGDKKIDEMVKIFNFDNPICSGEEAINRAKELHKEIGYVEYGISPIIKIDRRQIDSA